MLYIGAVTADLTRICYDASHSDYFLLNKFIGFVAREFAKDPLMHDDRRSIFPSFLLDASVPKWRASNAMPGERDGHSQRAVVWRPRLFRNEHGALADATVKKAGDCKPCAEGTSGANVHCDGDRAWLSSLSDIKISIATAGNAVAQKKLSPRDRRPTIYGASCGRPPRPHRCCPGQKFARARALRWKGQPSQVALPVFQALKSSPGRLCRRT